MNPQFEQSPDIRLPQPSMGPVPMQGAERVPAMPEHMERGREGAPAAQLQPMPMPMTQNPMAQAPLAVQSQATQVATPAADDTSDASGLDEEWINKAKQIVEQTHADPYMQSAELGKFKAEYLRSRHNKEVKVAEDSAR